MQVYYDSIETKIGKLYIGLCSSGLCYVGPNLDKEFKKDSGVAKFARQELTEYFAGERQDFDIPIAWNMFKGFTLNVLKDLSEVKYGQTVTYSDLNAKAPRAVGQVCAKNKIMIFIPCHRVIGKNKTIGGFNMGVEAKSKLLALENIILY